MTTDRSKPSIESCRRRLAIIWWAGGGVLIATMLPLLIGGQYFSGPADSLGWLLPHIAPSMMLTGAVPLFGAKPQDRARPEELTFLYRLAAGSSLAYLLVILFVIVIAAFRAGVGDGSASEQLAAWNVVLGVLQGMPASLIGVFFARH